MLSNKVLSQEGRLAVPIKTRNIFSLFITPYQTDKFYVSWSDQTEDLPWSWLLLKAWMFIEKLVATIIDEDCIFERECSCCENYKCRYRPTILSSCFLFHGLIEVSLYFQKNLPIELLTSSCKLRAEKKLKSFRSRFEYSVTVSNSTFVCFLNLFFRQWKDYLDSEWGNLQ